MAASENATKLANLIDPQVIADYIDKKLINNIKLSPLARIDTTLVGNPGSILTVPSFNYSGSATAVAEGTDIPISRITQSTTTVKVSKIGKAIEFTDEALLSGYNNDIAREAADQVVVAIRDKVEALLISAMSSKATLTYTIATSVTNPADGIADALAKFGEDMDGEGVLVIPPSFYTRLRQASSWIPNTELGANAIIQGRIGMVHGLEVVPMNRLTAASTAYIVKPGALSIVMKRDTLVEFDRDKIAQTNFVIGSKIFAPYVYDTSKLVKITIA